MTWLGALNFVVLQWFGVRLARVVAFRQRVGAIVNATLIDRSVSIASQSQVGERVTVGWKLLRWVWPLTGWWNDYRWIARRR